MPSRCLSGSRREQRLDGATLVHRAAALGDLGEREREIEDLARLDRTIEHKVDEMRQIAARRCGPAVQMRVREEQLRAVELDAVRDADVADVAAGTRGVDRLPHGLL